MNMQMTSRAFSDNQEIPPLYTCDGDGIHPPLLVEGIHPEAKSLVLIMEDIDSMAGVWDHWVLFNIRVESDSYYIEEAEAPEAVVGLGTSGDIGYFGPCPQKGTHRYVFTAYALDKALDLTEGATKQAVLDSMEGHVLDQAVLTGLYTRHTE